MEDGPHGYGGRLVVQRILRRGGALGLTAADDETNPAALHVAGQCKRKTSESMHGSAHTCTRYAQRLRSSSGNCT